MNIEDIIYDLHLKADKDLVNLEQGGVRKIMLLSMPDYSSETSVTLPYTATEPCLFCFEPTDVPNYSRIFINGKQIMIWNDSGAGVNHITQFLPIDTGDVVSNDNGCDNPRIFKYKGVQ